MPLSCPKQAQLEQKPNNQIQSIPFFRSAKDRDEERGRGGHSQSTVTCLSKTLPSLVMWKCSTRYRTGFIIFIVWSLLYTGLHPIMRFYRRSHRSGRWIQTVEDAVGLACSVVPSLLWLDQNR